MLLLPGALVPVSLLLSSTENTQLILRQQIKCFQPVWISRLQRYPENKFSTLDELLKSPYDSTGQTPLSETTSQKHYQHRKEEKNRKIIKFPVGPHKFSNIMQKLITDAES